MIRFIHTADIHFGMENYGKIDPKTGIHTRLLDFEQSLNTCIDYAIEEQVDAFIFSGDAYKTANPSPTQQKLFLRCMMRLYDAKIPTVIVVGNHDNPLSFGKANALDIFAALPFDGFHVFSKPEAISIPTKSGPLQVVGIPWPNKHNVSLSHLSHKTSEEITSYISQSLDTIIKKLAQTLDPKIPAILAGHLTVTSGVFSGSEKRAIYGTDPVLMPSQLAIKPFDYVALGHLHRFQNLNPEGIPIVYSGSIDRIDFGERKEEKGFCDVLITQNKTCSFDFIPLKTRPFIQINVTLEAEANHTQQILQALQQHTIKDAVLKIVYKVPAQVTDTVDIKKIQIACSAAMYLVGIIPQRDQQIRTHRNFLKADMDLQTLLSKYFDTKEDLKKRADILIKKTLQLESEIATEQVD